MLRYIAVMLLALPFVDMYILFELSSRLGFLNVLVLVAFTGLVGAWAVKREGIKLMLKLRQSISAREISRNLLQAGILTLGGLFMLTPGIISDLIGVVFVVRPVRERISARLENRLSRSERFQFEIM